MEEVPGHSGETGITRGCILSGLHISAKRCSNTSPNVYPFAPCRGEADVLCSVPPSHQCAGPLSDAICNRYRELLHGYPPRPYRFILSARTPPHLIPGWFSHARQGTWDIQLPRHAFQVTLPLLIV